MKLHNLIFIGMLIGVLVGVGLHAVYDPQDPDSTAPGWYPYVMFALDVIGPTLFMGALKMIIAPLILASIVAGVTSLPHVAELGAIGWKTLVYYACTTAIAVFIGLVAVMTIQPGKKPASVEERNTRVSELAELRSQYEQATGESAMQDGQPRPQYVAWLNERSRKTAGERTADFQTLATAEKRTAGDIFKEDILLAFLQNPFGSLAQTNALGIIFFALLLGIACIFVGEPARPVVNFFQGLNDVIMRITHWIMALSPVAIGCIVAHLVASKGLGVFISLAWYCGTVIGGIAIHVGVLLAIAYFVGGVSPQRLWRGISEAWMIAFGTRSSSATLPVTIANVTENLNVSPKVANFSLPLGATMNMDGTALYEGVAVLFLIQIFGGLDDVPIEINMMTKVLIFITAVLASVGAAAVPNAGLVTMVIVATAVGLPIYYIPMIFAVDAFLDMFRTSTNVLGDSVGAIVVNRLERGRLGEAALTPA
jgi:Na+/H+-dicarboxylate symporter